MNTAQIKKLLPMLVVGILVIIAAYMLMKDTKNVQEANSSTSDESTGDDTDIDPEFGGTFAIQLDGDKYYIDENGVAYTVGYGGYGIMANYFKSYKNPYEPGTEEADAFDRKYRTEAYKKKLEENGIMIWGW